MHDLIQNLRFAMRTLRRSWGVTVLAIGSLALAIAGNTIVFSLINGFLYRPLPYEQPERISLVGERGKDLPKGFITPSSLANFLDIQERQRSYETLGAFRGQPLGLTEGESVEQLTGAGVTPSFFEVLRVSATHGRVFRQEESTPGKDRVVLLSHKYWQERYGSSADAVGKVIELNGSPYDVVGVLPSDFEFLVPNTELYVPITIDRERAKRHQRDLLVVGRLNDGVTDEAAQAEMNTLMAALEEEFPEANRGYALDVLNLREELPDSRNRLFFKMMQGALLFVLLIACANIANLLLSRAQKREREMAVRSSIGASRSHIAGQLFLESLVMAVIAGALGLSLAVAGIKVTSQALAAQIPTHYAPVLDHRVLLFNLGVSLLGAVLFSLAPTIQTFNSDLLGALKDGSQASSAGGHKRRVSKMLVVGELAMALVFLAGANVLLKSFEALQSSDPGFDTAGLLTVQLTLPESSYESDEALLSAVDRLEEKLGGLPGVQGVVVSNSLPRNIFLPRDVFVLEASPPPPDQSPPQTQWMSANAGFFDTLGISVLQGREFSSADHLGALPVALVNQAMVQQFFNGREPLGELLTIQGQTREVVGVVEDVRHGLAISDKLVAMVYVPTAQLPVPALAIALRTPNVDPATLSETLRQELRAFDPRMGITQIQTLDAYMDQFFAGQKVFSVILRAFGGLALLLAALGTYGVLAYSVVQRTQEIGIRIALGAERRQVVGMILGQGMLLAVIGVLVGIPGIWAVTQGLNAVMAGFVPLESTPIVTGGLVLLAVTFVASLLPALRASSVDPSTALRGE